MKTPHAILIGLSLIAAAIFFKDTAVNPAHASNGKDTNMACRFGPSNMAIEDRCWIRQGSYLYMFNRSITNAANPSQHYRWRK